MYATIVKKKDQEGKLVMVLTICKFLHIKEILELILKRSELQCHAFRKWITRSSNTTSLHNNYI
jgi:hypothetical protein